MALASLASRSVPPLGGPMHFLGGERVEGAGEAFAVTFPVTSEVLCEVRGADGAQIDRATGEASRAFESGIWRGLAVEERATVLERAADLLLARREPIVEEILYDNGKTRDEAAIDLLAAVGSLKRAAVHCRDEEDRRLPTEGGVDKIVAREPVGVVLGLAPFNAPLMFAGLKAAPPLAAGNSVILKPSERAPLVAIHLCQALAEAGLPPGVLSLLHGGVEVAATLAGHPAVDLVSITGGTEAGGAVMRSAAATIKNLLLELGGKSAHIVLADADLERAIPAVAAGIFRNAGQRCFSGSRLVVEEAVADRVEEGVEAIARSLVVGDPFDEATDVGPLIDLRAVDEAERFVERAVGEGLALAAGGRRAPDLAPGAFFPPTVLVGADRSSCAAQEELFGPVLTSIRVRDADEAVSVANDSRYGLAGAVWTADPDRALEIARRVRSGYFWINTYGAIFGDVPFGGYGQSGSGREAGIEGFHAYTEQKTILIDTTGGDSAPVFSTSLDGTPLDGSGGGE